MSEPREERDKRREAVRRATDEEHKSQDETNDEVWNNKKIISSILDRQIEVAESLGEIKTTLKTINENTSALTDELGKCKEDIAKDKEEIKELKNKFIMKFSWKQLVTIIGTTATILGILQVIIHFFM